MAGQERRRYARIHFERQVQLEFFTEIYDQCQAQNISSGGMFVVGKFPQEIDNKCYVNVTQTCQNTYIKFQALAKVVRRNVEGIAIEFDSMSYESLLSLEMILLFQEKEKFSNVEMKFPENFPFAINDNISRTPDKYNFFLNRSD